MKLSVTHTTTYKYSNLLKRSIQIIKLTPQNNNHQQIDSWCVSVAGDLYSYFDWFGNICQCLSVGSSNSSRIDITATGVVETNHNTYNNIRGSLPLEYYLNSTNLTKPSLELIQFAELYVGILSLSHDDRLLKLKDLSANILLHVPYITGVTRAETTASEAFKLQCGVCQDHAHIMLAIVRYLGMPARYVSGYLYTMDVTHVASHAWVEVWCDNAWYSFDISNQCYAGENHIILAYGLDYLDASPIRGCRIGGGVESLLTNTQVMVNQ